MIVKPCPKCGRFPKIEECAPSKNGTRRRMVIVNCYHPCVYDIGKYSNNCKRPWFVWEGEGDDNTLFREWNKRMEEVKNFDYYLPQSFIKEKCNGK